MAIAYFTIPETGKIIYNGDTVILSEYPDTMAVASYGWYRYEDKAMNGWHFLLLPSKSPVPASIVNLSLLVVVPNSSDDCRCPSPVHPMPINPVIQDIERRTFITLDSMAQLRKLKTIFMPNGRIVRVNNRGDGEVGYYEWNVLEQDWDVWDLSNVGPTPVPEDVIRLKELGIITSVDSEQFVDSHIRYTFRVGSPLSEALHVSENTACTLYYTDTYQVIYIVDSQDVFIRKVRQVSPQFIADDWLKSHSQDRLDAVDSALTIIQNRLSAMEEQVLVWKENERLENALSGLPDRTYDELNDMLESRLNGDDIQ